MKHATLVPLRSFFLPALLALVLTPAAAGAQAVTAADIQRLQDEIYQAGSEVSRFRGTNVDAGVRLQNDLDDLREEAIYLKVRLRKEGSVPRAEYVDVRDRVQALRQRARGDEPVRQGTGRVDTTAPPRTDDRRVESTSAIPTGTEIDARLQTQLSSETAQVEDRFEATTVVDLYRGNEVLIPAGSVLRGVIRTVNKATRTDRRGEMTVSFDQVTVRGRSYPMRGTVTDTIQSEGVKGEVGRIGAGSAIGGVIGGIIGGVKGALLGVLIGGGGTIAATPGKDVTLPPGTILRVRLDTPPDIR